MSASCGVRTHAQLPAVDLKSTPLTSRANWRRGLPAGGQVKGATLVRKNEVESSHRVSPNLLCRPCAVNDRRVAAIGNEGASSGSPRAIQKAWARKVCRAVATAAERRGGKEHELFNGAVSAFRRTHKARGSKEIRTPNLLIWSQTRCRCVTPPSLQPASSLPPACLQPGSGLPPACLQPASSGNAISGTAFASLDAAHVQPQRHPTVSGRLACLRPYRVECAGSLPTSEVKRRRARLVLGWGPPGKTTLRSAASFSL